MPLPYHIQAIFHYTGPFFVVLCRQVPARRVPGAAGRRGPRAEHREERHLRRDAKNRPHRGAIAGSSHDCCTLTPHGFV